MKQPVPQILSWSLDGIDADGRFPYARDDDSVRQVLLAILLTRPGERLMRPELGAGLLDFVHQPNNQTTRSMISSLVTKAIERWEPRVTVETVDVVPDPDDPASAHITIRYNLRHTGVPQELGLSLALEQVA